MHMERSVFRFHELHKSSRMMVVLTRWKKIEGDKNLRGLKEGGAPSLCFSVGLF